MWAESSPDGELIWTSSGNDLLAYRSSDVSRRQRGPGGPLMRSKRRLGGRGAADRHDGRRIP